jgi:hypothetical protein
MAPGTDEPPGRQPFPRLRGRPRLRAAAVVGDQRSGGRMDSAIVPRALRLAPRWLPRGHGPIPRGGRGADPTDGLCDVVHPSPRYCREWCSRIPRTGSDVVSLGVLLADSVLEPKAFDEGAELLVSVVPAPAFRRAHRELEDRRERRLDGVTRAQVPPVFGWRVVEREHLVLVLREALERLRQLRPERRHEQVVGPQGT